jgi:VWFA-related protein
VGRGLAALSSFCRIGDDRLVPRVVVPTLILSLAVGAGAPGPAQTQAPPLEIAEVEAELLRVEAVVLDARSRPVPGLGAEDFVIREDGDLQVITHFQPAVFRREDARPRAAEAAVVVLPPQDRHVVLAIDDLHMSPTSMAAAKLALKRFLIEQAADDDHIAVVTMSGDLGLYQAFTQERAVLRRAIDRLAYRERRGNAGGRATMSEYEAESIDRGDAEAQRLAAQEIGLREQLSTGRAGAVTNPRNAFEATGQARALLAQALETTNMTLRTLEGVVRSLGTVSGRKLLVLVSDGFLIGQGTQDPRAFDMRLIFDASARVGVSVYALHSKGVDAAPPGGDASRQSLPEQAPVAPREGYQRQGERVMRDSMSAVAEGTGGFLVHGTNDLSQGLGVILRDSDSGYLLAYTPSHTERDGRYRQIQIEVAGHPEYTVRARKGYFAPDAGRDAKAAASRAGSGSPRDEDLRAALASLVPLSGVPLEMSADFVDQPPAGSQVVVRARIDLNRLSFTLSGERQRAELEIVGVVYDELGKVVGDVEGYSVDLDLTPTTFQQMLQDGLRYQKAVPLKPGLYHVRLVAREGLRSKLGTAFQWIEVPDLARGELTLSSVFLFAENEAGRTGAAASGGNGGPAGLREVQVQRRFDPGGNLYYWVYPYNPKRGENGRTDVVIQAQIWAGSMLQGASAVEPVSFGEPSAPPRPVTGQIALKGLQAGDYELRVVVVDKATQATSIRRVSFTIG